MIDTTVTHEHNYAGSETPGGPATSANKLTNPVNIELEGAVVGSAEFDGSTSIKIKLLTNHEHPQYAIIDHCHDKRYAKINHTHDFSEIVNAPDAIKNPNPLTLTYAGENPVKYDGETAVEYDIPASHKHYTSVENFPEEGSEHTLYTDSDNMTYRWDPDTKSYHNIGVPITMMRVIDGNLV